MKRILMALLLALGVAGLQAAESEPLSLKGKIGIGLDSMPGLTPAQVPLLSNVIKTPDTVVLRWWISDKISWEGQIASSYSSAPQASNTTITASSNKAFGIGTAVKWNFKRPTETSFAQLLLGLDYGQFSSGPDQNGYNQTTGTFSVYVGPGFEFFMPFMHALSVEGSVRLRIGSTVTKSDQVGAVSQSSSDIDISGYGFSPLNLSMHYYF